ncbi:MAG: HPr family phosphocarrier protein [Syntrophales bacterium]|nr:HPr family phosphocarrier protein [Syntrophales bacterium]PKN04654.1 MAG: HPr family phosphocarrier protein [Deltaproteobacteria bacterium HGW-Deltaproteobacteria-9]
MEQIKTFEIKNKLGLHARAAAKLVQTATKFKSRIYFEKDGWEVNGKSLLGILTLECPQGSRLIVRAEGMDAIEAIAALGQLIENKFDEE